MKVSFGLHFRHCDSGTPCSSHQSPCSLKTATRSGLHCVHRSAGTPCSHSFTAASPWASAATFAGGLAACAAGADREHAVMAAASATAATQRAVVT